MMGRSHLIIGTGVSLSVLQLMGVQVTAPAVTVALIGSLLPDIDEPNSLLVSKALPNSLIRLLQTILLPTAVFVYFTCRRSLGICCWPFWLGLYLSCHRVRSVKY